jgi:tryptophan-rich sensory protein
MSSSDAKVLATANLMSKNLGLGVFLTLFFGGVGLLYANIPLGIIGVIVEIVVVIIAFFTAGIGILLLIPWHIFTAIVTMICINRHNKRLLASL